MDREAAQPVRLTRHAPPSGLVLFSVLWALASAFHVLGSSRNPSSATLVCLGIAVGAVLLAPGRVLPLVALAMAQLATVWSELPTLGNHWALAGFVDVALIVAVLLYRRDVDVWPRFAAAARLCLLGFYAFAAFAKLNSGFLDPDVSCGVFYLRESADSLGVDSLATPSAWVERTAIWSTLAVELSVPVLLAIRRTRTLWVPVAMVFHLVLALDRTHQFYDFSSVLLALFVLLLPDRFAADAVDRARAVPWGAAARVVGCATAAGLLLAAARYDSPLASERLRDIGWAVWQVVAVASLAAVVGWLVQHRGQAVDPRALRVVPALAIVPVLVVLNGFTPYLELKTAFGWNMYANLRTVHGETNHLVVPATAELAGGHGSLYEIVSSSDAALEHYGRTGYALPERTLRAYLHDHPDVALSYRRDGGPVIALAAAADEPGLVRDVPVWEQKLRVLRPVDVADEPRCQDVFGPLE